MKKSLFFACIISFFGMNAQPKNNSLFYDLCDARINHQKNMFRFKQIVGLPVSFEEQQYESAIRKAQSAGGTKKFIEIYALRCRSFTASYSTCKFHKELIDLKKYFQSDDQLIEEIETDIKQTHESIQALKNKNSEHQALPLYTTFHDNLQKLLFEAQKSS